VEPEEAPDRVQLVGDVSPREGVSVGILEDGRIHDVVLPVREPLKDLRDQVGPVPPTDVAKDPIAGVEVTGVKLDDLVPGLLG